MEVPLTVLGLVYFWNVEQTIEQKCLQVENEGHRMRERESKTGAGVRSVAIILYVIQFQISDEMLV